MAKHHREHKKPKKDRVDPIDYCAKCTYRGKDPVYCGNLVECNHPKSWYCQAMSERYDSLLNEKRTLEGAYARIRTLLNAFDGLDVIPPRDIYQLTETRLKELIIKAKNKT